MGVLDHGDLAQLGMVHALTIPRAGGLGILHHLVHGVDRRGRDPVLLQHLQQRLAVVAGDGGSQRAFQLRRCFTRSTFAANRGSSAISARPRAGPAAATSGRWRPR